MRERLVLAVVGVVLATIGPHDQASQAGQQSVPAGSLPPRGTTRSLLDFGADRTGGTDSSSSLQAAVQALAGTGVALEIPGGTYLVASSIVLTGLGPLSVYGYGATINAALPTGNSSFQNALFYATSVARSGASAALTAPAVKGSTALNVGSVSGFSAGQSIIVARPAIDNVEQQFTIESVGTGTIVVDDPIEYSFQSGDPLQVAVSVPTELRFFGLTISGTGGQAFELQACQRCQVKDVTVTAAFGSFSGEVGSFDVGGRDNLWENVDVDGGNVSDIGLAIESNVRTSAVNCNVHHCTGFGYWVPASARFRMTGCHAWTNDDGAYLGEGGPTDVDACQRFTLRDSHFYDNTNNGLVISGGSDGELSNVIADHNATGIALQASAAGLTPTPLSLSNTDVSDSSFYGVGIAGNGYEFHAANLTADRCGTTALQISGPGHVEIHGLFADDSARTVDVAAAADVTILGGHLRQVARNGWDGVVSDAPGARLTIDSLVLEKLGGTGTSLAIDACEGEGAITHLSNVRTVGQIGYGLYTEPLANTLAIGDGCDFSSSTTPLTIGAGTIASMTQGQGTFTDTATSGVTYLTQTQAQSTVISSASSLTGNLVEVVPSGIPGLMYVAMNNATTNGYTWSVAVAGGAAVPVQPGSPAVLVSDGTNMRLATLGASSCSGQ